MKNPAWTLPLFLMASFFGCDSKKDAADPTPATKADAKLADTAKPAPDAAANTPLAAKAPSPTKAVAGIPPAPKLAPLAKPAGPKAEGNVAKDVEAALAATGCKIEDGELVDCPAQEAYGALQNNWIVAKPEARAKTMINLLGSDSPSVRLLVLEKHPLQFIDSFAEELREDIGTYEPYFAVALAEQDPSVRAGFAWDMRYAEFLEAQPSLVKYVGALAEAYSDEEGAGEILEVLAAADDGTEGSPARAAMLGVAARNPDPKVRARATGKLPDLYEDTKTIPLCELALGSLGTDDEDLERSMTDILTDGWGDCSRTRAAWLEMFVPNAKAGKLDGVWLDALMNSEVSNEAQAKELRAIGEALATVIPEDHELRYTVDGLREFEY